MVKTNSNYEGIMGSFDGAETCELVGLYVLATVYQLRYFGIQVGYYRDGGLTITDKTHQQAETKKKRKKCTIFSENELSTTTQTNQKVVDFLNVTFDLYLGLRIQAV
ncbi:hypothetical protein ElyMa_001845000 [Elysia marginata]|uniref:Uncharacterized protein n=1 Tax=Elysia marginata TaxID=1093978 RepID=A0AAV4EM90_9GAST|nr:hypothetical protein ElyMa_001845000 [Elysia marginata]